MNFKKFYVLKERRYFVNLTKYTGNIIKILQKEIKSSETEIEPGQVFNVPIDDDTNLEVAFYKGASKRLREYIQDNPNYIIKDIFALYFSLNLLKGESPRIEVYINNMKNLSNHYKKLTFSNLVNKNNGIHPIVSSVLRHELSHAYEDLENDLFRKRMSRKAEKHLDDNSSFNNFKMTEVPYYDQDTEHNAHFLASLTTFIKIDPVIKLAIVQKNLTSAVQHVLNHLQDSGWYNSLSESNKNWVKKTTYTYLDELIKKL